MTEQTTEIGGQVAIREADDVPHLDGLAVPWTGSTTQTREYPGERESFQPGSFTAAIAARQGRRVPFMDEHADGTRAIVGMVDLTEAEDGLRFRGPLLTNQAARDYAERVAAGADGVSVQFLPGQIRRGRGSVTHTSVGQILALAGTYAPAYQGAQVALREDSTVTMIRETEPPEPTPTPTPDPEPTPDVRGIVRAEFATLRREMAESVGGHFAEADPYASLVAFHSLGEIMQASYRDAEVRDTFARALADQIGTVAVNPGVMTPGIVGEVHGIIAASRPGVDAFGTEPLTGSGMSVDWPYFSGNLLALVGVQATQKTEITSAVVPILKGTSPIATYAGGSDVALQLIRRSSPSYLDAYGRILTAAWAAVTDKAFVDAIEATAGLGAGVIDFATATADQIRTAIFNASAAVQVATGSPASFVLASATAFAAIGGKLNPQGVAAGQQGNATASELAPNISGLPVILDPNVNTGTVLVSNRQTAAWHEDGPFNINDLDVAKLGQNVAIWSMGATAVYLPAGIIKSSAT